MKTGYLILRLSTQSSIDSIIIILQEIIGIERKRKILLKCVNVDFKLSYFRIFYYFLNILLSVLYSNIK